MSVPRPRRGVLPWFENSAGNYFGTAAFAALGARDRFLFGLATAH